MNQSSSGCLKIVAAVTLRHNVHGAMLRAVSLARVGNCEVALVHAKEKNEAIQPDAHNSESLCHRYEEFKSSYSEITSTCLKTGSIWNALLESARGMEANLIIIGSHVHSQLATLAGYSTDRVLRYADRDVLITRTERYTVDRVPDHYQHILVTTDLLENHQQVVQRAIMFAQHQGAKLSLIHVLEHYPVDRENDDIAPENKDPIQHRTELRTNRLNQLAHDYGLADDVHREVISTNATAYDAISTYAQQTGVDLIAIGSRQSSPLNILFGSNADRIVQHAPCDVLVVHLTS